MTVWLVIENDYEDSWVVEIFTTEALADEFLKTYKKDGAYAPSVKSYVVRDAQP
jgi:hypothetical protein